MCCAIVCLRLLYITSHTRIFLLSRLCTSSTVLNYTVFNSAGLPSRNLIVCVRVSYFIARCAPLFTRIADLHVVHEQIEKYTGKFESIHMLPQGLENKQSSSALLWFMIDYIIWSKRELPVMLSDRLISQLVSY